MQNKHFLIIIVSIGLLCSSFKIMAQIISLEDFESKSGWEFIQSDGVNLELSLDKGLTGDAIRFDYDFTKGTGYGGIQKCFPIDLPDNYEFSFYIKAESPANNFEIKFIDSSGDNVWWVNNRNYDFPEEWRKIRIRKRHISFAWGPTEDRDLKRIDRIEFTVASFVGGKGTIWIDNLTFEPLPPETSSYPPPSIETTSSVIHHPPELILDHSPETYWQSAGITDQHIFVDFKERREFGGLHIEWLEGHAAESFEVLLSDIGNVWEKVYSVGFNQGNISFMRLPEAEARYLKLILHAGHNGNRMGIREMKFLDIRESMTMNDFLIYAAEHSPAGHYPRYFSRQASYWTVVGVNNDMKEGMINEDGMVEVDKGLFSIEPMIKMGDSLFNWSNVNATQSLGFRENEDFIFRPSVSWPLGDLHFVTSVMAGGEANVSSMLGIEYSFENTSGKVLDFEFFLLIRPYQVNPYYQWLNLEGGAGRIININGRDGVPVRVDEKVILSGRKYDAFRAAGPDEGNIVSLLQEGKMPLGQSASDPLGLANGVIKYNMSLQPGQKDRFSIIVPFYDNYLADETTVHDHATRAFEEASAFWGSKTSHIRFNLPPSAERIINTYKANLVYILINRDKAGIQPGSRSYERSWIRDGSLTSSALLKSGIVEEVRDFIDWYADHQYENGKVPCVVDFRGPDPVPEHDSHGQLIYLIREYFNFTKDTLFLKEKNYNVLKAVDYMESLIAKRSTDHYKYGNDSVRAHYGLVPESISHEGYSEKPMHSYWDNFFIMKGLKDAADIQEILNETDNYERIKKIRDTFRVNLYKSIDLAMKYKSIDYIPGCVELGDFDATSTTIALTPCNELNNLPKPQVYNTFERYYEYFVNRRDAKIDWVNYTPYENRLIGSFIILDQPERAHELIEFFLDDQRPQGWYHWAEVVWKDYRRPGFIGDMPHTWVGSDFINAIRSMFVYENEYDESLVIASALYQDWIDTPGGMSVENLPTYYGDISYSILKEGDHYQFKIYGDLDLPDNGLKIRNFNSSKRPVKVVVNGREIKGFNEKEIPVMAFPAEVMIYY
ncbi:MAG: discoidin domain-containing protein [Bacteroidales bacterium]